MNKSISVDQAIRRGHILITGPSLILLVLPALSLYLLKVDLVWVVLAAIAGLVFSFLFWGLTITKWKIWAYTNVRNVHELKEKAIELLLIYPEESSFNAFELATKADKEKLQQLEDNFLIEDDYSIEDGDDIPAETKIHKSSWLWFLVIFCVLGVYLFAQEAWYGETESAIAYGVGCVLVLGFIIKENVQKLRIKDAYVTINAEGMSAHGHPFVPWKNIDGEGVVKEGKSLHFVYYYTHFMEGSGMVSFELDDLAINKKRLLRLLKVYRSRYEKSIS